MPNGRAREAEKKGCGRHLLVGCGTLLVLILVAVTVAYTYYRSKLSEYTSPTPVYLPEITMSTEEVNSLRKRVGNYGKSLEAGTARQPLALSGEEINALIQTGKTLRDLSKRVYIRTEGEKLSAEFSLPLDGIIPLGEGRYLNGTATVDVAVEAGRPVVRIESMESNGREIPETVVRKLQEQLPFDSIASEPDAAAVLANIESVDVKDGQLIIRPKSR